MCLIAPLLIAVDAETSLISKFHLCLVPKPIKRPGWGKQLFQITKAFIFLTSQVVIIQNYYKVAWSYIRFLKVHI